MARRRRYRTRKAVSDEVFLAILATVVVIFFSSTLRSAVAGTIRLVVIVAAIALGLVLLYFASKYALRWYTQYRDGRKRRSGLFYLQDKEQLQLVSPTEFEKLVCEFFSVLGYEVQHTGRSNDGGIDGRMWRDGKTYAIQAKLYTGKVGASEVRDFYGSYAGKFDGGFFVTTSDFSPNTREWAKTRQIELINGDDFISKIPRETLVRYIRTN